MMTTKFKLVLFLTYTVAMFLLRMFYLEPNAGIANNAFFALLSCAIFYVFFMIYSRLLGKRNKKIE